MGGLRSGFGRAGGDSIRAIHPRLSTQPVRPAARSRVRGRALRLSAPDPVVDRRGDRIRSIVDIDIVIHRTLVYGILTASLALVYFGSVAMAQAVLHALTDQSEQPQLVVVVSTLVIAALFNPLRGRIKSFIDRRFYRSKYDARKTLEAFSATLNQETDLDALSEDLVSVVRGTMQPTHVSLWLRPETDAKGEQIASR